MNTLENMHLPKKVVIASGHTIIGGLSRVFHCNYYNAYLQMAVLLTQDVANHNPERLLTDSVTTMIHLLKQRGYTEHDLLQEFSYNGFGLLRQLDANTWETPSSHYGEAVCIHGKSQKSCYFTSGYLQGLLGKTVVETECKVKGASVDKFVTVDEPLTVDNYLTREFALQTMIPERFAFEGCQTFKTRVAEKETMAALRTQSLYGDNNGLINIFGAVLTNHFADYYNRISYETYFAMRDMGIPEEDSKEMFIQAGHICAFNTFGRIMTSSEWYKIIAPQCDNREDWLHGMVAAINILGWGIYRIEKIIPAQELVMRVYNSYEGIGFRRMYPPTNDKNISFLAMGATLGLAHLLWKIDIRNKPELTQEFYVNQFNHPDDSYSVEQTHAIATGDEYDRFVVS